MVNFQNIRKYVHDCATVTMMSALYLIGEGGCSDQERHYHYSESKLCPCCVADCTNIIVDILKATAGRSAIY